MNSIQLIGRLTKDPEVVKRDENNNPSVTTFTLAVDRDVKKEDGQNADFIRIISFGKQAATVDKYLSKGRQVAVLGRIQTGSYQNKEGEKVYTTDVVANRVEFLGSSGGSGKSAEAKPEAVEPTDIADTIEDTANDIPF